VISMNCGHGRQETLGAFLARVKPGDSCTCCGGTLRAVTRAPLAGRGAVTPSVLHLASTVIVCPECGCEISEDTGPDAEDCRGELSPAA
jgi:hypothetical protein